MNLFLREMKAHRKSLILWSLGMVVMIASGMGKYAGLSSSGQSMNDLSKSNAKVHAKAFMGTGTFRTFQPSSGYYGILFPLSCLWVLLLFMQP